jgi:hypothetical protein
MLTEELLTSGEIITIGRLVDASNATLLCELLLPNSGSENERIKVVYKPIAGERPLWDFPDGNLASREVAAFQLSQFAGFDLVPVTVLREGPFGNGAVQEWIEVDPEIDVISIAQSDDPRIRSMALFDYIINNTDRKFGHILIDSFNSLYGCDHGVSFHQDLKLRTVLWQFAGETLNDSERQQINKMLSYFSRVSEFLSPLISEPEITALRKRLESLRDLDCFPYPNPEWPAIPWPPV